MSILTDAFFTAVQRQSTGQRNAQAAGASEEAAGPNAAAAASEVAGTAGTNFGPVWGRWAPRAYVSAPVRPVTWASVHCPSSRGRQNGASESCKFID